MDTVALGVVDDESVFDLGHLEPLGLAGCDAHAIRTSGGVGNGHRGQTLPTARERNRGPASGTNPCVPIPQTFAELQANPAFIVYLPRVRDRADHSRERLREVGFDDLVLVEGVDGLREDPRAIGERRGFPFDPGLAAGEMGCALSMIGLWEKVVDEGLPYMLVFEDDVLPHPDLGRLGPQYWAETPRETDFVFLGNQLIAENLPDPSRRVVVSPSWCLHAYVITQEGARRALALLHEQVSCFDRWLSPIDIEARRWMEVGAIRYFCWNGTMLPAPYPSTNGRGDGADLGPNVVRSTRCTGLFFQNYALGSTIWPARASRDGPRRPTKPKAVLIVPTAPSRYGNGLAMRAGVALEGLAMSCDVTLVLAPVYSEEAGSEWIAERADRVHVLSDAVGDPLLRRVLEMPRAEERDRARLVYPRPYAAAWSTPAAAASVVDFTGGDADLVYLMRSYLAPLADPWLQGDDRTRVVLDVDEYDPASLRELAEVCRLDSDADSAEVALADADKLERMAAEWVPRFDLVLAASAVELDSLQARVGTVAARVLPNPVPMRGDDGWAEPADLLLVANFSYAPNADGARWLCGEVLPRLRRLMGREVRVTLAGSYADPAVAQLGGQGVVVVGNPESVTPLYEAATVAVAPLRAGGGTRLKILEAFGHRRAVVSTSRGADGLPVTAGRHLLIADDAEAFAEACQRVLSDDDLRRSLVSAAVDVAIVHAWTRVATTVSEIAMSEIRVGSHSQPRTGGVNGQASRRRGPLGAGT